MAFLITPPSDQTLLVGPAPHSWTKQVFRRKPKESRNILPIIAALIK